MEKLDKSFYVKNEQGNVAIIIALSIVIFISIIALSIDIGYALVTRNQLQMVADSSALAAARVLGHTYETGGTGGAPMTFEQQQAFVANPAPLIASAQGTAKLNKAGGTTLDGTPYITINASDGLTPDVIIGHWDGVSKTLTPTLSSPDAVQVTARRDASANGPITTFFAGIFGIKTTNVSATAIAALTGQSTAGAGGIPVPLGISNAWFTTVGFFCDQPIKFYPTGNLTGCAGWDTYTQTPASANQLRQILQGLNNSPPTFTSPPVTTNRTQFNFVGGNIASDFPYFQTLFDTMRVKNDGVFDHDTDSATWTTTVVVYDSSVLSGPCANPNTSLTIVGLATVTITGVLTSPSNEIDAVVKCNFVAPGRGGGGNFGTKGSIPGLVK